ncbi:hypothetical protein MCP1_630011 [Candidatus Terasakiella magnetica]|nr:hypothetical protein MCP1_630011 [Candidatus Terasakiella magnetica]
MATYIHPTNPRTRHHYLFFGVMQVFVKLAVTIAPNKDELCNYKLNTPIRYRSKTNRNNTQKAVYTIFYTINTSFCQN